MTKEQFTILASSRNKTKEGSKTKKSSWPYSTGAIYVKYPQNAVFGKRDENLITGNN